MSIKNIAYVNVSCANIYRQPTFHCEVDSQAVLWEKLEILNRKDDFILVVTEDHFRGWINAHHVITGDLAFNHNTIIITESQVYFYIKADDNSAMVRDGVAGIQIPVIAEDNGWIKTRFPDGIEGWIKSEKTGHIKKPNRTKIVKYANTFTGIPYSWGGKTIKGFDCSGFVQFIHKMFGINLRRDAWMQFEDSRSVSKDPREGQLGDLMFFAEGGNKISHVGFCLEQEFILHCQGMVKRDSLNKGDQLFNEKLMKYFVEIKSFLD